MSVRDDYIERIEKALEKGEAGEEAGKLVKEVCSVFAGAVPDIKKGLDRYKARVIAVDSAVQYDNHGDLVKLLGKLRLDSESDRRRPVVDEPGEHGSDNDREHVFPKAISINVSANADARANAMVKMDIVQVSQVIKDLPERALSQEDKALLKSMLLDLEAESRKDKSSAKEKAGELLKFFADKGVDVAVAVAPYIFGLLSSLG